MTAGGMNADGFIRCCKALHLVAHQSIPCVDDVLKAWHARQCQALPSCSRPRPRPPSNPQECKDSGKPKSSSSCSNCVAWGKAVEDVYYPQSAKGTMPWGNVNPLCLPTSPVEIAKAFVLRLQHDKQYTTMEHFDAASVLMIMMHFGVFHGKDQNKFDIIKKVSDARNKLCHMQLEDNLYLDDQQVDDIFSDINDLIACLETLHPLLFTSQHALDIRIQLSQIKTGPVTAQMKKVFEDCTKSVEEVTNQTVKKVQTAIKEMEQDMHKVPITVQEQLGPKFEQERHTIQEKHRELRLKQEELSQEVIKEVKETIQPDLYKRQPVFDVSACRQSLMAEYQHTRSKLTFLPGMPDECADMDDLYVELDLLEEEKTHTEIKIKRTLKTADELFTLQDKRGKYLKRILVKGGPGSGKSCTISKLAYDWAQEKVIPGLSYEIDLLFALDLREIRKGKNLIDAIQDQLLPKCSKDMLISYIESHAKSIVFLLDGFDEAPDVPQHGDIKHLLSSKWLQESLVIVTTRPLTVAQFVNSYGVYSHIQLTGFSLEHIKEYVLHFLQFQSYSKYILLNDDPYFYVEPDCPTEVQKELEDIVSFLNNLVSSFPGLCQTPLTLSMLCRMWSEDKQSLTQKITDIYGKSFLHLAKHKQTKFTKTELNIKSCQQQLNRIMLEIGETALSGLFQDRLIFQSDEFNEHTLCDACQFGLLSMERKRSKFSTIYHISFFHKTFQEYCAAKYWSSLLENDKQMFMSYLQKINPDNVINMKILLQFCCGLSCEVAEIILPHIVGLTYDKLTDMNDHRYFKPFTYYNWNIPLALLYETDTQQLHTCLLPLYDLPSSQSKLFRNVLLWLTWHYMVKYGIDGEPEEQLDRIIATVGIVALKGLQENRLLFDLEDFESAAELEIGIGVGVISKDDHGIYFVHKVFQEYLAAAYLDTLSKSKPEEYITEHVSTEFIQLHEMFLVFCCGMSKSTPVTIVSQIANLATDYPKRDHTLHDQYFLDIDRADLVWEKYKRLELPHDDPLRLPILLLFENVQSQWLENVESELNSTGPSLDDEQLHLLKDIFEKSVYAPKKTAVVDHMGDFIYLSEVGASIQIPTGCIKEGTDAEFCLSVHWGDESPTLRDNECLIGPTVLVSCYPVDTVFLKPVVITLPHSASNIDQKNICIQQSRLETSGNSVEWTIFLDGIDIQNSDTIKIHTTQVGCYMPCYSRVLPSPVHTPSSPPDKADNTGSLIYTNDSKQDVRQEGNPEQGHENSKEQKQSNEKGQVVTGNRCNIHQDDSTLDLIAMVFVDIRSIDLRPIVPLIVYIARDDERQRVIQAMGGSSTLVEEGHFQVSWKIFSPIMQVLVGVKPPWSIQVYQFGHGCTASNDSAEDTVVLVNHMANIKFVCMKPQECDEKSIFGEFRVCGKISGKPQNEYYASRFDTVRELPQSKTLAEIEEIFRHKYMDIVELCLTKVLDKAGNSVVLQCEVRCKCRCTNKDHEKGGHGKDILGWLWRIIECKAINSKAKQSARELNNLHHRNTSYQQGVSKDDALQAISVLEDLVKNLLPLGMSSNLTDAKRAQIELGETKQITDEAMHDIKNVRY